MLSANRLGSEERNQRRLLLSSWQAQRTAHTQYWNTNKRVQMLKMWRKEVELLMRKIMAALLLRQARNSVMLRRVRFPSSSSSPSLKYCLFSSTSSSSTSASNVVSGPAAAVSDVADVVPEDDLIYSELPAVSNVKLDEPSILQPRVVVYDGVCHLCHRGISTVISS